MRATIARVWDALCAGREPRELSTRIYVALGMAVLLWWCAYAFLLLEPGA